MKGCELIACASGARAILFVSHNGSEACIDAVTEVEKKLFSAILEAFKRALLSLVERAASGILYKAYLVFDCSIEGDVLTLVRRIKVILNGKILVEDESVNKLQIIDGKYLKRLKNSKKQRFIPSRNGENIKRVKKKPDTLKGNKSKT